MKTAEEIAERSLRYYREKDHEDIEDLAFMIKEYAKQKCKKQRELCSSVKPKVSFGNIAEWAFREEIRNAPEPEFD